MIRSLLSLCMLAAGLVACNLPARSVAPAATQPVETVAVAPPASPSPTDIPSTLVYMPQQMRGEVTPEVFPPGPLIYYWPASIPPGTALDNEHSYADEKGYQLSFQASDVKWINITGGEPADAGWDNVVSHATPATVRGLPGYIFGTGAGFGAWWMQDGQVYGAGGMGVGYDEALALAEALEVIDLAEFQSNLEEFNK